MTDCQAHSLILVLTMPSHHTNCIFKICAISRELRKLHWWTF